MVDRDKLSLALADVADTIRCNIRRYPEEIQEDLESEANLAAIQAWSRYNANKGASWRTFAERRIVGAISNYITRQGRPICDPEGNRALSLDELRETDTGEAVSISVLATSAYPTVQRRVRMTTDTWNALELLSARQGEPVSVTIQNAVQIFLTYTEKQYVKNR